MSSETQRPWNQGRMIMAPGSAGFVEMHGWSREMGVG